MPTKAEIIADLQIRATLLEMDVELWKEIAGWDTEKLVQHLEYMRRQGSQLPNRLPTSRPGLVKLLACFKRRR